MATDNEHVEQRRLVQWFRQTFAGVRIFSIPNGGHRHLSVAAKLKAEGATSGVPDLYVPQWRLWIEMKRSTGGRLSKTQIDWIDYLTTVCGDDVVVGSGFEDAREKILEIMQKKG
jgi:hypothetical protein